MREGGAEEGSAQGLLDFVTGMFAEYGYLIIFIGSAGDNLGIPATGDVVMFAGGWLANTGRAALPAVMLVGALGGLIADNASYWVGRLGGRDLIDRLSQVRLLSRLVNGKHLAQAERYFETHGGKTVAIGRFTPGMRGATPLFAGLSRMPYPRFLAFDAGAIAVWAVAYPSVGYVFGEYWDELLAVARSVGFVLLAVLALILGIYVYRRRKASREE